MPDLPQNKVGIIACSGEELPEGTITRQAALHVLEDLRPGETVTICLPLFLAGGEGDRAFAKFYPTIALDGCEKRCAFRGTAMYSNQPAGSVVVTDLVKAHNLAIPLGKRKLNEAGKQAVEVTANQVAGLVDELLGKRWSKREGKFSEPEIPQGTVATCSCGSGIPVQTIQVGGRELTFVALPLIFQNFIDARKSPSTSTLNELMEMVKIYNPIDPQTEPDVAQALSRAYQSSWDSSQRSR
jgi:uncharacterized metal-binding protein